METGIAALCVVVAVIILNHLWKKRRSWILWSKLPGPSIFYLMKLSLYSFACDSSESLQLIEWIHHRYGPLVRVPIASKLFVLMTDPEQIEKIVKHDPLCSRFPYNPLLKKAYTPAFKTGLFTIDGEKWKKHRKIINNAFHTNTVEGFVSIFSKNAEILSCRLQKVCGGSQENCVYYFHQCTGDIVFETTCLFEAALQKNDDRIAIDNAAFVLHTQAKRMSKPWLLADFLFNRTELGRKHKVALEYGHDLVKRIIDERKASYEKMEAEGRNVKDSLKQNNIVIDYLLQSPEFNSDDIIGELSSVIAAGSETTAYTVCYALSLLCENQDVQEKLLEEQRDVFGAEFMRPITMEDILHMPYLDQVVKETMRLFPAASTIMRTTVGEVDLGNGQIIPNDCGILIMAHIVHRNPDHFPDPQRFDPNRFSPENCEGRHPYAYIPFGLGRRKCVGYYYGILEVKVMLSTVLRRYHFLEVEGGVKGIEKSLQIGIATTPKTGFKFNFVQR